jgi:hypothetical protein
MSNELIVKRSWWTNNWKWFLPFSILLFLFLFGFLLSSNIAGVMTDITQGYSDHSLYEKAIESASYNKRVQELIGDIEPIDQFAILEGNIIYSNNNNTVALSIRIKGSKGKGKMDIMAERNGTVWKYNKIIIRIKEPKEEIQILKKDIDLK